MNYVVFKVALLSIFWLSFSSFGSEFDSLYKKSVDLIEINSNKALKGAFHVLDMANESQDSDLICKAYRLIGYIYKSQGNQSKAIENYLKALNSGSKDPILLSKTYLNLSTIFRLLNDYDRVIEFTEKSLTESIKENAYDLIGNGYYNLTTAYREKNEIETALYYNMRLKSVLGKVNDLSLYRDCFNHAGLNFLTLGRYDSALHYFKEMVKYDTSKEWRAISLLNQGLVYLESNNTDKASSMFYRCLKEQDPVTKGHAYLGLAKVHYSINMFSESNELLQLAKDNHAEIKDIIEMDSLLGNNEYVALREKLSGQIEDANNQIFIDLKEVEIVLSKHDIIQHNDYYLELLLMVALVVISTFFIRELATNRKNMEKKKNFLEQVSAIKEQSRR